MIEGPNREQLEGAIRTAVRATAARISEAGNDLPSPFNEPVMQTWFVDELGSSLSTLKPEVVAHASGSIRSIKLPGWPTVGPVDVVLADQDGDRHVFFELKWGEGTVYNCIWDLAKMGAAVSLLVRSAYLLAGAPDADWEHADGAECFSSGTHKLVDYFEKYPKHWRFWLGQVKTHPLCLPKLVTTTEIASVSVQVRGEPWTTRCAAVSGAAGTAGRQMRRIRSGMGGSDSSGRCSQPSASSLEGADWRSSRR